ncbi:type I restriction modification DNA specificity domain protein [Enterococcus faecalis TX1346]|nr:restriction endonuclease subunit S [Enterococcus faecalis]EFU16578.1 type I restriction modification DNA specificity domain protein [Enterococcus faecalis TX1346]
MMSKKSPQLRFEGFTDDWEERKLGDLLKEFSIKSKIEDEHKVLSSTNSGMEFREGRVSGTSNLGYKIIKNGDLVLSPQNLWLGNININNIGKGLVSPSYKTFEFINIDSSFINPQLRTQKMLEEYKNSSTQGASVVRRNLEIDSFYQIKIFVPTISEQEKIGSFFKQIDDTIDLHQRKLDLLKEQKKGFLQKMFPKNGAKVPELRFAGFADDWEERKLSDVANHRGGTAIEKYFDKDGVYKVISIGSYGLNSQYVDQNIRAISNEITDGRVVNSGELTMVLNDKTANGTIIGRSLLVEQDNEYVINQRTEIISPKETFDSNFAYTILNGSFREKVKRIVQGGTQIYVNYSAVSNLSLELPKIEEQQKIGSFFKQLDNTIALHQRKLDLLKEQKKGFLQKMFV